MGTAVAALALVAMLLGASGARAVERVYWDNGAGDTIGVADVSSGAASLLSTAGAEIDAPGGMSYDPVTSRLYVASGDSTSGGEGLISYVSLNGGGVGILSPAGAPVRKPRGVVIDPVARIAYWLNTNPTMPPESISWARLDGSAGGELEIGTAPLAVAVRLAIDPLGGRLYWGNGDGSIGFAPLVGVGGTAGMLEAKGAGPITGLAVDPAADRVFWAEGNSSQVFSAGLSGEAKSEVDVGAALIDQPRGLAFDPTLDRLYWGNSGNETDADDAIGFSGLGAGPGGVTPSGAGGLVDSPQDPVIIKSPVGVPGAPPMISSANRQLNCSQGSWEPDYVSSFVYQAATSYAYQWTLNEVPIEGATGPTYAAPVSGRYRCIVTASNFAGSTSRTSPGVIVTITVTTRPRKTTPTSTPARLVLAGQARNLRAKPGRLLTLGVRITNQGTVASIPVKLCLKLTKKAKRALKAGKCVQMGAVPGGAAATAKLRLRVKRRAKPGLYKLRIALPAAPATKVTVRVLG